MARLVLVNGAPGAGKSTVVDLLAREARLALPVDVDTLKHSLGRWQDDPAVAGLHARRLAEALAGAHLGAGYDVLVAQYLARVDFIAELESLAAHHGATFRELVLDVDVETLRSRLAHRAAAPDRAEHEVNNRWVGPPDAEPLVRSIDELTSLRPLTVRVDARGSLASTLERVRAAMGGEGG